MSAPRPQGAGEQLTLPFETEDPTARLATEADELVALNRAVRFLLDLADGRASPNPAELRHSLDVLAALNLPGRLGRVLRQFRTDPPTEAGWEELARELAFAISLYPGEPIP